LPYAATEAQLTTLFAAQPLNRLVLFPGAAGGSRRGNDSGSRNRF
jgi:hypothetical protein